MKKILIILVTLLVVSISVNSIVADTSDVEDIKVVINYNDEDDNYVVEISDSEIISDREPTMVVETHFDKVKVYFDDGVHELELIDSEIANSTVSFKVKKGGKFFIEKDHTTPSPERKYSAPKTGIN